MDECGIDAQVIFPSTIGLGGQDLGLIDDDALCRLTVEIYNDRMAEIQADSDNRLLPDAAHAGVETSTSALPRPSASRRSGCAA